VTCPRYCERTCFPSPSSRDHFTRESEEQTKRDYLAKHDLRPWIALAKETFEPFRLLRRAFKADGAIES